MNPNFEKIQVGDAFKGPSFQPTRQTIKDFCDASLDHNPLHLDDKYMEGNFGKTSFGGIIMHGMSHFSLMTRMLNDWLMPQGAIHRRLETRWLIPVKPGDTIRGQYRVEQVSGDAVLLSDTASGASSSLALDRKSTRLNSSHT